MGVRQTAAARNTLQIYYTNEIPDRDAYGHRFCLLGSLSAILYTES